MALLTPEGVAIHQQPRPYCSKCGGQMYLRIPRPDKDWKTFWGCSDFPTCTGSREIDDNTGVAMAQGMEEAGYGRGEDGVWRPT